MDALSAEPCIFFTRIKKIVGIVDAVTAFTENSTAKHLGHFLFCIFHFLADCDRSAAEHLAFRDIRYNHSR